MSGAWYNEFDPKAAAWLRELIAAGHLPAGDVDERSIVDVQPDDLRGYAQCHFFAGIGGWPLALRLAGWPDDRPVWTGSCPCQPFSNAGPRKGADDERHLWPIFRGLIAKCRPPFIFGEQVASALGRRWLSGEGASVQAVQDREAVLGLLRELEGRSPLAVHPLYDSHGAGTKAKEPGADQIQIFEMASAEAGACVGEYGEAPSEGARSAIRPRSGGHTRPDRERGVRNDGDRLRSIRAESVERTLAGSGRSSGRLRDLECQGSSVFAERHGEHLGTSEDYRDCVGDYGSAAEIERAVAAILGEASSRPYASREPAVRADLEALGYAVGAADLCAAGVGAPHIRQRLWFGAVRLADANDEGPQIRRNGLGEVVDPKGREGSERPAGLCGVGGRLADADGGDARAEGLQRGREHGQRAQDDGAGRLVDAQGERRGGWQGVSTGRLDDGPNAGRVEGQDGPVGLGEAGDEARRPCPPHVHWRDADWLFCRDGKWRPVEPGTFPLAHGLPARVGRLRGYGNAIVPQLAATFVNSFLSSVSDFESAMI